MNLRNLIVTVWVFCGWHRAAADENLLRVRSEFRFHLDAPYDRAAPLFGALAERKWAPDWHPEFLYPKPAGDEEGSVFLVDHHGRQAVWVNTAFDLKTGHVQYVYFLGRALVTRIDIRLSRPSTGGTDVQVVYERTALEPGANKEVRRLGELDGSHGPDWKRAIETSLKL